MLRIYSTVFASMLVLAFSSTAMANMNDRSDNLPDKGTIVISGTVAKITDSDEFDLSYDGGTIHVDTNDAWPNAFKKDANNAAKQLNVGDHVVVAGKIDNNFFSKREIDARSLRFEQGGQIFSYDKTSDKANLNVSR